MVQASYSDRVAQASLVARLHDRGNITATAAIAVAVVAATAAGALIGVAAAAGKNPALLVRDPASVFDYSPAHGLLSHVGVFAMVATTAICLFAAPLVREGRLLVAIALFSGYFLLDDFFVLHERLLPDQGIPEAAAIGLIAVMAAAIFALHWRSFLSRDAIGLWVAGVLLAASVKLDLVFPYSTSQVLIEDVLKFAGLMVWSAFWILRAFVAVGARVGAAPRPTGDQRPRRPA